MQIEMIPPAMQTALALPLPITCAIIGIVGLIIGSFLNVVIYRLPREQSIVFPNSACPTCRAPVRAYDNIPVLSFLMLRGRCRSCRKSISWRYPTVELLTAFLFAAVTAHDGTTYTLPFDLAFIAAMLALIFIDADHMILPNAITYPGILFALITRVAVPFLAGATALDDLPGLSERFPPTVPVWAISLIGAAVGAVVGGGSLWLMGFVWQKLRGVEAMGLGDVKMMFMVGAYFGWRLAILTIFIGVFTGSLAGIALMLRRGGRNLQMMLPFGIFLGIGAIITLFVGHQVVEWYGSQFH